MNTNTSNHPYQICTKTVMDTSDPNISFDSEGICNHYYDYFIEEKRHLLKGGEGDSKLKSVAENIKLHGKNRPYDCILGLSGGVDSTYLCLLAKRLGLRPLVVHFDNGWNSELAVSNIENTVKRLGFDLYTYVVDWSEFKDLQRSYFKANVVDIEVLTDHGFMAVLYQQARKHRIKYVLGGMNVVTEAILPKAWIFDKADTTNICDIQSKFGKIAINKLKSYPFLPPAKRKFFNHFLGLEVVSPLNYVDYKYEYIKQEIKDELGWRDYGGKHYESIFTRFYQGYILQKKFNFDKRRAHFSTLICSGQLSRDKALSELEHSGYDADQCDIDMRFVLKKLGISNDEFQGYLSSPAIPHSKYRCVQSIYKEYPLIRPIKPFIDYFLQR